MNTYDYRKQKQDQARIDEALAQSNGGAQFLAGGKPSNTVREISRAAPRSPLLLPFDEITPSAVNVPDWGSDGRQSGTAPVNGTAVTDTHESISPLGIKDD